MRMGLLALAVVVGGAAQAEDAGWTPMSGAEITEALTGNVFDYKTAWQDFRASGRTLYNAGSDSWGYWAVREDQYCSMWPPSDLWACYDMAQSEGKLRFIGEGGDVTDATLRGPIE